MHRLRCLLIIGALAMEVIAVAAGPAAAAKGGNNDTAKLCQKGAWQTLLPDAGGTFSNQGDCVNDGAQGSAPFGAAGRPECGNIGGSFAIKLFPDPSDPRLVAEWNCVYMVPPNPTHPPGLPTACSADTTGLVGVFQTRQINASDQWVAICAEFV
jgi:hypothetical protein